MNNGEKNDEYFEIEKINIDEFDKSAKKEKAILLGKDIAFGVLSVLTSTIIGVKGYIPFLAFIQLFTIPMSLLVVANVKILSILKKEKAKLLQDENKEDENTLDGGKTR